MTSCTFFNGVMAIWKIANSSQETDSSQEVTEHLNPWSRILDEAQERHEIQLNALVDEYERNGDSENVAHLKAQNALLLL